MGQISVICTAFACWTFNSPNRVRFTVGSTCWEFESPYPQRLVRSQARAHVRFNPEQWLNRRQSLPALDTAAGSSPVGCAVLTSKVGIPISPSLKPFSAIALKPPGNAVEWNRRGSHVYALSRFSVSAPTALRLHHSFSRSDVCAKQVIFE